MSLSRTINFGKSEKKHKLSLAGIKTEHPYRSYSNWKRSYNDLWPSDFNNLDVMDKFHERQKLPKLI